MNAAVRLQPAEPAHEAAPKCWQTASVRHCLARVIPVISAKVLDKLVLPGLMQRSRHEPGMQPGASDSNESHTGCRQNTFYLEVLSNWLLSIAVIRVSSSTPSRAVGVNDLLGKMRTYYKRARQSIRRRHI